MPHDALNLYNLNPNYTNLYIFSSKKKQLEKMTTSALWSIVAMSETKLAT